MYIIHIVLSSWFSALVRATTFAQNSQGISDLTNISIPTGSTQVQFNDNLLSHIIAGYFKHLPKLTKIFFRKNKISSIEDHTFTGVPTVQLITLEDNRLLVIRKHTFSGLRNLKILDLFRNEIHTVEPESFVNNTALTYLDLGSNSLQTVSEWIFHPQNHPTGLKFYIDGNPLSCNNTFCWLKGADGSWITVSDYGQPAVCANPGALNGITWLQLTEEDLCCPDASGQF